MSFLPAGESDKNRQIKKQNPLNFSHIIFDFALLYPPFCSAFFLFYHPSKSKFMIFICQIALHSAFYRQILDLDAR